MMNTATRFAISGREIGGDAPPYVIAELSANHNGSLDRALELVDAAATTGAHAIKLQTYTADTITIAHESPEFRIEGGLWHGRTLHDLYDEAHTPWDWHRPIFERAAVHGLHAFSSPFDETAVDFLESLNVPAYKIASFEAVDLPLISRVAATGKPLIISTGMADLNEIGEAVEAARGAGCTALCLLHCVSGYPTPVEEANLSTIAALQERFNVPIGLSDHTLGTLVPVVATGLGASVIEKHFTLRRDDGGPDSAFSLEPIEFETMCRDVAHAASAVGKPGFERKPSETGNATFRRSLYVVADVSAGAPITTANVRSIRPGYGLAPKHLPAVLGRPAARDLKRGTSLSWGDVADVD